MSPRTEPLGDGIATSGLHSAARNSGLSPAALFLQARGVAQVTPVARERSDADAILDYLNHASEREIAEVFGFARGAALGVARARHERFASLDEVLATEGMSEEQVDTLSARLALGLEVEPPKKEGAPKAKRAARIDLNRATLDDLLAIPGLGNHRARSILEARSRRKFKQIRDVLRADGVGWGVIDLLVPHCSIDGRALHFRRNRKAAPDAARKKSRLERFDEILAGDERQIPEALTEESAREIGSRLFHRRGLDPKVLDALLDHNGHLSAVIRHSEDVSHLGIASIIDALTIPADGQLPAGTVTRDAVFALVARGYFPPNFVRSALADSQAEERVWVATKQAAQVTNPAYARWEQSLLKVVPDKRQMQLL